MHMEDKGKCEKLGGQVEVQCANAELSAEQQPVGRQTNTGSVWVTF